MIHVKWNGNLIISFDSKEEEEEVLKRLGINDSKDWVAFIPLEDVTTKERGRLILVSAKYVKESLLKDKRL